MSFIVFGQVLILCVVSLLVFSCAVSAVEGSIKRIITTYHISQVTRDKTMHDVQVERDPLKDLVK